MKKRLWANCLLLLLTLACLAGACELFFIWRFDVKKEGMLTQKYPDWIARDPVLMWRPKENAKFSFEHEDGDGTFYRVDYSTGPNGFRQWGNLNTGEKKMLVVGDSFTLSLQASNDKTYYHLLGKSLGAEVFAFAADGYNTVQEMMALEKFVPLIKPGVILLQFYYNDWKANDSRFAARTGLLLNPDGKQPYWDMEKHKVVYAPVDPWPRRLYKIKVNTHSRFIYFLTTRLLGFLIGERPDTEQGELAGREKGVQATVEVFREIRRIAGPTPVYIFSASRPGDDIELLTPIAEENGFHLIREVQPVLQRLERESRNYKCGDHRHWNEEGHREVAGVLADYFKRELYAG